MVRLRATIVVEYDANPEDYDTDNPLEMAQLDASNDPVEIITFGDDMTMVIEPVS